MSDILMLIENDAQGRQVSVYKQCKKRCGKLEEWSKLNVYLLPLSDTRAR